jgi:hypothetical protein
MKWKTVKRDDPDYLKEATDMGWKEIAHHIDTQASNQHRRSLELLLEARSHFRYLASIQMPMCDMKSYASDVALLMDDLYGECMPKREIQPPHREDVAALRTLESNMLDLM